MFVCYIQTLAYLSTKTGNTGGDEQWQIFKLEAEKLKHSVTLVQIVSKNIYILHHKIKEDKGSRHLTTMKMKKDTVNKSRELSLCVGKNA